MTPLWAIVLVLLGSFVAGLGQLFLKKSSVDFKLHPSLLKNSNLWLGAILNIIPIFIFIYALKHGELSVLYPAVATTYIWASLFAKQYLGESLNKHKWLGMLLIIVGVLLITL